MEGGSQHHTAGRKYFPQTHILPRYWHFLDLRLAFARPLLQDAANWALCPSPIVFPSFSPSGRHGKHNQSGKRCCLLCWFYCPLHIQRSPWCPFPYLSSIFWAQNSNSVTHSYGINKEMNHHSLDEDRALEPSNPQSAHIYRHARWCC